VEVDEHQAALDRRGGEGRGDLGPHRAAELRGPLEALGGVEQRADVRQLGSRERISAS
jgi:hypothetical protein